MGYVEVARHKTKDISLYRQGKINYVLNREPGTHAERFVKTHGPCAPAMAWRVVDAAHALKRALDLGATEYTGTDKTLDVPAVTGSAGRCSISSKPMARKARHIVWLSIGSAMSIRTRLAWAFIIWTI